MILFVIYNLKLKNKQIKKIIILLFDNNELNDDYITENRNNIKLEQGQGEDNGRNIEIIGPNSTKYALNNILSKTKVDDAHLSSKKKLNSDKDDNSLKDKYH